MKEKILITGGAGFIGSNLAKKLIENEYEVYILDNLSRKGSILNIEWLKSLKKEFHLIKGDITDKNLIYDLYKKHKFSFVFHLAAQVAVTTSIEDPEKDLNVNIIGSFNILEGARRYNKEAVIIYSSTNKVYGSLKDIKLFEDEKRYISPQYPDGFSEDISIEFHTPYGCSKGTADQYFLDYSNIYGMKTIVFRQSCIYGPRQFGIEDQGWVAWFLIASNVLNKEISIFGDGKQVRDILYIDDLINLYQKAIKQPESLIGEAYNIGGGIENSISLLEFIDFIKKELNIDIKYSFQPWRAEDQKFFVCNYSKINHKISWKPKIHFSSGLKKLNKWIEENRGTITRLFLETKSNKSRFL